MKRNGTYSVTYLKKSSIFRLPYNVMNFNVIKKGVWWHSRSHRYM